MRGSIEKRLGADGKTATWTARWGYDDPATGKRRQKRSSHPTRKAAEAALAEGLRALGEGPPPRDEKLTVAAWSERWLAEQSGRVRPQSHRRYADLLRLHVLPEVGAVKLAKLAPAHLSALYAAKLARGLSPTTVGRLHAVVGSLLKAAVLAGHLASSPAAGVRSPRPTRRAPTVWSAGEARRALAAAGSVPHPAFWRLALLTGLRRGEMLALRWEDVDLDAAVVRVRRTRSRNADNGFADAAPKTAAAVRAVALPASCVAALRVHREEQDAARAGMEALGLWEGDGRVFCGATGKPLHATSIQRAFDVLIAEAGVPRIRLHDLRHSAATMMLEAGVNPKTVAAALGHESVRTTLDVYSHVTARTAAAAAAAVEAMVEGAD